MFRFFLVIFRDEPRFVTWSTRRKMRGKFFNIPLFLMSYNPYIKMNKFVIEHFFKFSGSGKKTYGLSSRKG